MPDEKHEPNRNGHFRQKLLSAAAILLLVLLAARFSIQYLSFVSQTIYQESTSHLEEVLHKSNNMLKEMVRKNVSYLHLYNCFLESTSDADAIQAILCSAATTSAATVSYHMCVGVSEAVSRKRSCVRLNQLGPSHDEAAAIGFREIRDDVEAKARARHLLVEAHPPQHRLGDLILAHAGTVVLDAQGDPAPL